MRTTILASMAMAALAGCATITPQKISGPDGKTAYAMRCSGAGRTLEACYEKAGEICTAGYTVVDRASGLQQTLVVECK